MLCAISGEAPQEPVASRKSGNVFERRLIEQYIRENSTDPVNGEDLAIEDLLELKQPRTVRPRPPTQTSIPALLASLQNEWDAAILESYQLKQQLSELRQELSTALYYNDSAEKVIARLQKERDEARDALSKVTISPSTNGANGDAMQVDSQSLPEAVKERVEQTQSHLSATRRKRPIPEGWATADDVQGFEASKPSKTLAPGGRSLAVDQSGDLVLLASDNDTASVYSLSKGKIVHTLACGAPATRGVWCRDRAVLALANGQIKIFKKAKEEISFSKHAGAATDVCVHPSGDILASVGEDKSFVLYDLETMKPVLQHFVDTDLTVATFHPDGHLFTVGTTSGQIKLFDLKTMDNIHNFSSASSAPIVAASYSENGVWLATAAQGENSIVLWDLRKLAQIKSFDIGAAVANIAWDYTGQYLAACGPGNVSVQHYEKSSKSWSELLSKAANAVDVQWGSNARSLITFGGEGTVTVLSA